MTPHDKRRARVAYPEPDPLERNGPRRLQQDTRGEFFADVALVIGTAALIWGALEALRYLCRVCFS
jgi:hypothetical protein